MSDRPSTTRRLKPKAFFTKQFYLWHWVSSALCLASMLFFAVTGITLNHAASIPGKARVDVRTATLPSPLLRTIAFQGGPDTTAPLPPAISRWLRQNLDVRTHGRPAEWSEFEIYVSLPRPGGDAWLAIDRTTGETTCEITRRGAVAYLNDLHKGRNTGGAWSWFIDLFSIACVIFTLTGLGLLWVHARRRPITWPVVAAGIVIPVALAIFLIH